MKEFIYIPSFSTGTAGNAAAKGIKLKDGTPWRFWEDDYPKKYQHKSFLVTAGHYYKKIDHFDKYHFTPDVLVMGDSGGYQIATGAIEWNIQIRDVIFKWLERNSQVALNLDIPCRGKYMGKYNECLQVSVDNFKYFAKNQSGKTDFLNVLQGSTYDLYSGWYNAVKGMPFAGWAIGGGQGSITSMLAGLAVLHQNGEMLQKNNKWLHILGTSGIPDFLILAQIQRSLNEIGSNVQLTTDSSTPAKTCSYGFYYYSFDLANLVFKYLNIPRKDKLKFDSHNVTSMPILNEVDELIWKEYTLEQFTEWKSAEYAWLVSHNFAVFKDCISVVNNLINNDIYFLEQILNKDIVTVLKSIDELMKSNHPADVYKKYIPVYERVSRNYLARPTIEHKFF